MSRAPRVLFVSYGGGHISMVLPVIRELEALLPEIDLRLTALHADGSIARYLQTQSEAYLAEAVSTEGVDERLD